MEIIELLNETGRSGDGMTYPKIELHKIAKKYFLAYQA